MEENNAKSDDTIKKYRYEEHDPTKWHNNCRPDIGEAIPEEDRKQLADKFGPNWASFISGCGDQ